MAEQERNEEGHASDEDVSMDEILTSLRSILEEEETEQSSQPSEEPEQPATPSQPLETEGPSWSLDEEAGEPASGDDEELVLTDVVDEDPASPEPSLAEEPPPVTGSLAGEEEGSANENEDLDSLIGSLEEEATPSSGPELEPTAFGGEDEGAEVLDFGEPAPAEPEPAAEPAPAAAEPAPESATAATPDPDAIRQTVEATVSEQVAQATADLDSRLAEALEPKIREALEGYLSERLPALLHELAEAEIERIKRGE